MKKFFLSVALLATSFAAQAGGYLTNTNQNVAFLRNPAQGASINLNGVYSNPAGVSFMDKGFHLGINWQAAFQTREVTSTFGAFKLGAKNGGQDTKLFKGEAQAPVIPSVQAAWVGDRWSFHFNAAIVGGGGKAEYKQGLASFEVPVAMAGVMAATRIDANLNGKFDDFKGYDVDAYMQGRQYFFGATLGAGYKISDNWAAYAGVRAIMASAHYEGYLKNMQIVTAANTMLPATAVLGRAAQTIATGNYPEAAKLAAKQAAGLAQGVEINTDQSGFGLAPIFGVHYHNNRLDLAAKYEMGTKIELSNKATNNAIAEQMPTLASYRNGVKTRSDIPALLTLGARYAVLNDLRLSAGYHLYFDKASKSGIVAENTVWKNEQLKGNTQEFLFGAEYDITPDIQVSAGVQRTIYPNADEMMHDASFNVSSTSVGLGVGYTLSERVKLNMGYFHTFYDKYTKETQTYNGSNQPGKDIFTRSNQVVGIGLEVKI